MWCIVNDLEHILQYIDVLKGQNVSQNRVIPHKNHYFQNLMIDECSLDLNYSVP